MPLSTRRDAITAKIETTYGVDAAPTGAANAMLVRGLTVSPMNMATVDRALIRPYFGRSEQLPGAINAALEFEVELAGSGAAGTAPAWGPLLRACGFAETLTASTRADYLPRSTGFESATIYCYRDAVLHKLTGARGTVSVSLPNQGIPVLKFKFTGKFVAVSDATLTGASFAGWQKPALVNGTNTTPFTLHGFTPVAASLDIDVANSIVYRDLIGGAQEVLITDRAPQGSATIEATTVAAKNWWSSIQAASTGSLAVQHGQSAGNIVEISAPAVQLVSPSYSEQDNVTMLQLGLQLVPGSAGNDELKITVR